MIKFDPISRQYDRTMDCLDYMKSSATKRHWDCHLLRNRNSIMTKVDLVSQLPIRDVSDRKGSTTKEVREHAWKNTEVIHDGKPPGVTLDAVDYKKVKQSATRIFQAREEQKFTDMQEKQKLAHEPIEVPEEKKDLRPRPTTIEVPEEKEDLRFRPTTMEEYLEVIPTPQEILAMDVATLKAILDETIK